MRGNKKERKIQKSVKGATLRRYGLEVDIHIHDVLDRVKERHGCTNLAAFYRDILEGFAELHYPQLVSDIRNGVIV